MLFCCFPFLSQPRENPSMSGRCANKKRAQSIDEIRKGFDDKTISPHSTAINVFRTPDILCKACTSFKSFGSAFYREWKRLRGANFGSESVM